jgi:isoaspartyl peptidase/L-asparaginase-like protein (Ntn-hydrolase superfamily)
MTGVGERIMVLLSAKRLCDLVADGKALALAARVVLDEIDRLTPGAAGLIALDAAGTMIELRRTRFMAAARRC